MNWREWLGFIDARAPQPPQSALQTPPSLRIDLDDDAQPLNDLYNRRRRADRSAHELLGLLKGIVADGRVMPSEVILLTEWLVANAADRWPFDVLLSRINRVLEDDVITSEECAELHDLFTGLTGQLPDDAPPEANPSTKLPLTDPPPNLVFLNQRVVFTGRFVFGTRVACEQAVIERGGTCGSVATQKTNILVIGNLGSRDWIQTSYGRKIETAVAHIRAGNDIAIVSEQHWTTFL